MGQMMPGEKAKDFKGTAKKMLAYLGGYKTVIALVILLAVASTVFAIVSPRILGGATDELFYGLMRKVSGAGGIDFNRIARILLQLAGLYLCSVLFSFFQGYLVTGVSTKITQKLRGDIDRKIHRLPFNYFDKNTHGDVMSRITNDVDTVSQTMSQSLTQIITSITMLIGILVMMLTISPVLTLVSLLIIPLSTVFVVLIVKKSQKYFVKQHETLGLLNGHIEEMFSSHAVVKAFNGEKNSLAVFGSHNETMYETGWKSNFLSGLMFPITNIIGNIGYVAICIIGGAFAAGGTITVGGIQAFIQYVRQFNQPVTQVANIANILQQTAAAAERVFAFLGEAEETPEHEPPVTVEGKIEGRVAFEHVAFGYGPDKRIIHDFSAVVEPGRKVAIIGPTGAGKTTVVKLLMRFYAVDSGRILLDGQDIRHYTRDGLRAGFGMVLQDTWLFNGTIAENIRYGKPDATEEQMLAAAQAAQADHFVRTLPDGYHMVVNEEADNISQGQKQLLTIARSILADPQVLILDEATSSVDTRTEMLIQKAMDNLMRDRTSFIIAHRLSTIKNADLILVMRDGDIVEQGKHEELLALNGFYAELYNSQFEDAA
jgi:ATP-binding cassette subfamily B protein